MIKRFNIPHPSLQGYTQQFEETVLPDLIHDEDERKIRVRLGLFLAAVLVPPSLWLAWYFGVASDDADPRVIYLAVIIPIAGYMSVLAGLRKRTKTRLVKSISDFLGWSHSESEDKAVLIERLRYFSLLPDYDVKHVGDVLRGDHERWFFEMCELHLDKEEVDWRGNTTTVTVFQGAVLSFNLAHPSSAVTVITRDPALGHPKNDKLIKHEGQYKDNLGVVTVRSSDPEAVSTVLCPRFQQVIVELVNSLPGLTISCLIDRNYLHIPIQGSDKFELDWMFDSMDSSPRIQKILNEFSEVLMLLDIVLKRRACRKTGEMDYPKFRRA